MTVPSKDMSSNQWERETISQTRERLRRNWGDYPMTILIINPINLRLVRMLGKTAVTPNQLTIISFLFMGVSACCLASVQGGIQAIGGCLLLFAYLIDCLDGDLARFKNLKSPLGAMLDPILDRFGEFAIAAGAAIGGWRISEDPKWLVGGIFLVGMSQIYFYLVDAMVWKLPEVPQKSDATQTIKLLNTRVRFGAIEPYFWGQAAFSFAGIAYWAVPLFGLMFTVGCVVVFIRLILKARKLDEAQYTNKPEDFGTHTR